MLKVKPQTIKSDLVTEYVAPVRVIDATENMPAERLVDNRKTQVYFNDKDYAEFHSGEHIILDFGKELHGGARIITLQCAPQNEAQIRLRFGESLTETCAELGEKNATNHHAIRDMVVYIPNLSDQVFGRTGFRFLRIDFLGENEIFKLLNVYAVFTHQKTKGAGSFSCSDALINDIYNTARYTIYLNMQENLYEGIKRDRLVWVGDLQPEVLAITYMYGSHPLVEKALSESIQENPLPSWFGAIPCYSAWLIKIVYDYYMKVKNDDFLAGVFPYLEGVIQQISDCVDSCGNIDFSRIPVKTRQEVFFDWQTNGTADALEGNRFVFIMAVECMQKLCEMTGREENFVYKDLLQRLNKPTQKQVTAKQVVAVGYLTDRIDKESAGQLLFDGGAKGLSTFMGYFIFSAMAKACGAEVALSILKDYYGGMLSRGATTFWEDFDIDWLVGSGRIDEFTKNGEKDLHGDFGAYCYKGFRHSLCHGWACGAVPFLTEYVLGVNVIKPRCKEIEINPHLANLSYCKGVFPTPYGKVKIFHKVREGVVYTKVDFPKEIKITFKNCIQE